MGKRSKVRCWVLFIILVLVLVFSKLITVHVAPSQRHQDINIPIVSHAGDPWCAKWAVVAPLDADWASVAVRRQVKMKDWCLIIVFDEEPSRTYDTRWFEGEGNRAVITLTPENAGDEEFVKACNWQNRIGRKNIGYFYAISHGAEIVWDFEDDNMLKFWIPGAAPPHAPSIDECLPTDQDANIDVLEVQGHDYLTWNPYPAMGGPTSPSWPRGLPIDDATNRECGSAKLKPSTAPKDSIAILHSLSDHQPDVDALYKAILPIPFYFKKTEMKSVLVPQFSLTPYNAKATIHFKAGLWALFLPTSVDKEFSDVWRSYIVQRLLWESGLRVGIVGRPLVVQDSNIHTSLNDISKLKSMSKTIKKLINFLTLWRGKQKTFIGQINELWLALHENKFVGKEDIRLMSLWLEGLARAKYELPKLLNSTELYPTSTVETDLESTFAKLIPKHFSEEQRYTATRNTPEYDSTTCHRDSSDSFTFWTSDIHFGSRLDQTSVLGSLGNKVLITIGKRYARNPFVWKMSGMNLYERVSNVIKKQFARVESMNNRLTEQMIIDDFKFYKNDPVMASVDAFICLFQPGMCEMWMPFNKSIVFIPAHRYNMGRCTIEETRRLNEHLNTLAAMEHPKHIISASSKYDLEYIRHYTGLGVLPLYSYCIYVASNTYAPSRDEIPLFVRRHPDFSNWDERFETNITKVKLVELEKLYKHYSFSDLVQHRAIVFLPYAVMTYKMTELYTMSIPLFFPSMKYFRNIRAFGPDRSIVDRVWCHVKGSLNDSEMVPHPSSIHPYSPNALDKESEFYWLQLADFVEWPHITYFDDFEDLEEKLLTTDFDKIHKLMVEENKRRRKELETNWCKVFQKLEKGRKVPKDYKTAIQELYGVHRLQVY